MAAAALVAPLALGGAARAVVAGPVEEPAAAGTTSVRSDRGGPPVVQAAPPPTLEVERPVRTEVARPERRARAALLVRVDRPLPVTARPGGGAVVGRVPTGSRYYGTPTVAWVLRVSGDGRYGLVQVPYDPRRTLGWIPLRGLRTERTRVSVRVDLSRHLLAVERAGEVVLRARTATGAPSSPTPPGRYFVTDRVSFPPGHLYGTFAFGLSGIQPRLPAGWSGGDQLAIHGTNEPWTIGRSVSAGCLRVSEPVLRRLRALLRLGTPVVVRP
ncbi:MAG TPA: L,D-transpeptidase [Actinomycetota bacterium]|nr:L,D-transpeptidase [Actinomycetota bacterium]